MTVQEYKTHIEQLFNASTKTAERLAKNRRAKGCRCVDKFEKPPFWYFWRWGESAIPGGVLMIYSLDLLDEYFQSKAGQSWEEHVHMYCGFMFTMLDLDTYDKQKRYIDKVQGAITKLSQKYNCHVSLRISHEGTAKEHMK